jgi:integrase/recombinase XerC
VEQNPFVKVRTPKLEKRLPVFLEELEINEILTLPDKDTLGLRDQAILELLYATGCRVSELVGLTVTNIDLGSQYVLLLGKGNKERIDRAYLLPGCTAVFASYTWSFDGKE